jgi:hypothetical protein
MSVSQNHRVGYYYRADNDSLTLVWRMHDWAGRNLRAKGIREKDFLKSRDMLPVEIRDYVDGQYRLIFTRYNHVAENSREFMDDERLCGVPEDFIAGIMEQLPLKALVKNDKV